ncbi:hypothetical protein [Flagellimonas aequoris]|nr:hypothetical protein [Allomuricauda aequoris]TXK02535.1 hypothetical protein FQ019_08440 [Allomuricauda aequoris]
MEWAETANIKGVQNIEMARFLNIREKKYVFESLHSMNDSVDTQEYFQDFISLEVQRYHIMENSIIEVENACEEISLAVEFCAKSPEEKQKTSFKINANLKDYLVKTDFLWTNQENTAPFAQKTHYLFMPSYLKLAPKELSLIGLNSMLLDLMDYSSEFSFHDILNLVSDALGEEPGNMRDILLEYITGQVLYYRTFLVAK